MRALRLLGALGLALGASLAAPVLPATLSASVPLVGAAPAAAAGCSGSGGVTVVVDYNQLGGGTVVGCVANGGGRTARGVFTDAGARQSDVRRTPGFVCRINDKPSAAQDPCVNTPPANAYWSLWWAEGDGSGWVYSSLGVDSLKAKDGGYLAYSWQGQQARTSPSVTPSARTAPPSGGSGEGGGSGGSSGGGSGGSGGSGSAGGSGGSGRSGGGGSTSDPSDGSTGRGGDGGSSDGAGSRSGRGGDGTTGAGRRSGTKGGAGAGDDKAGKKKPGAKGENGRKGGAGRGDRDADAAEPSESSPLTDADGDTEQVSSASEEDPAGLPVWVPLVVIAVLGLGGVGAVLQRRRTRGSA